MTALDVTCPTCFAPAGTPCKGTLAGEPHSDRILAAVMAEGMRAVEPGEHVASADVIERAVEERLF